MKKLVLFISVFNLLLISCSEEVEFAKNPFVVAFETTSGQLQTNTDQKTVNLIYSEVAKKQGEISIEIFSENAVYGSDFVTEPQAVNNVITLPISVNEETNSFKIIENNNSFTNDVKIKFTITSISVEDSSIQGNTSYTLSGDAFLGGGFEPTVGGSNEPNQVYIELKNNKETVVRRDKWDLGFYGGDNFRVVLNGALFMATTSLNTTDMASVTSASVASLQPQVAVGTFIPSNVNYIDSPNGSILETAIAEISDDNTQNKVYLLNMGAEVSTASVNPGSASVAGGPRGWKKIRVLRDGDSYKLQYANLDDTSFNEITIPKDADYNFKFFSFNTNSIVNVEPPKTEWDLCFSVFTNVIGGAGSYGYSDFIFHNRKGGVTSYRLVDNAIAYEDFKKENVDDTLLQETQTEIGSSWRSVFSGTTYANKFYVLKDAEGNYYKIKFLSLLNAQGERGYPKFEFKLLE